MSSKQFYEKYIKEELEKKISANKIRGSNQGILHQSEHGFQIAVFGCVLGCLYYHANKINKEFNLIFKADDSLVITKCEYSISPLSLSVVNEEKNNGRLCPLMRIYADSPPEADSPSKRNGIRIFY